MNSFHSWTTTTVSPGASRWCCYCTCFASHIYVTHVFTLFWLFLLSWYFRSIFWELEDMIPFSNHPLYRTLWGWMGAPEVSLLKLFQGPVIRRASVYAHVVQESIMPIRYLSEGIGRFDEWYGVYPLLVFPLRVYDRGDLSGFLHPQKHNLIQGKDYGIWVDLGAYGAPRKVHF